MAARVKGVSVIHLVKTLRKNRQAAEALLAPRLHRYLNERLLPTRWYPEKEYQALLLAVGELLQPHVQGEVWPLIGEEAARADFEGVYAGVVRHGDPWGTLGRLNPIWRLYRETGRIEVRRVGPGQADVSLRGYPHATPEFSATLTGYLRQLLVLSGAEDVQAQLLRVEPSGAGPAEWRVSFRESPTTES